jgi:ATP-dependent Clp protease ATP-binding subunit ClpB
VLPNLQKELESEEALLKDRDLSLVRENVGDEEIALIISRWTGIPVAKLRRVSVIRHFTSMRSCTREL